MLVRKNVTVDVDEVRRLARRLGMSDSAAIRYAVDRLLHEAEVLEAATVIRRRGGLDDAFAPTQGPDQP